MAKATTVAAAACMLALCSCSDQPPLPPPGASQAGQIHIWPPDAAKPFVVTAHRIEQVPGSGYRLVLHRPAGHWKTPSSHVTVQANWASNDGKERGKSIRFDEPVHLHGWRGKQAFVGRAETGWVRDGDQALILEGLTLRVGPTTQYFPEHLHLQIGEEPRWEHGRYEGSPAPAWWQAVLHDLPRPQPTE